MGNLPFDRVTYGFGQKPKTDQWNRQASQYDRTLREILMHALAGRASATSDGTLPAPAFLANGFRVVPVNPIAMQVQITAGYGFQYVPADVPAGLGGPDLVDVDDLSAYKPLVLPTTVTINVPAADGTHPRIDIIEVKANRELIDLTTLTQFDETSQSNLPHAFYTTLSWQLLNTDVAIGGGDSTTPIGYKTGTPAAIPVAPTTTAGYVKIAEVYVDTLATTIDTNAIADRRSIARPGGVAHIAASFRLQFNGGSPNQIVTALFVEAPPGMTINANVAAATAHGEMEIAVVGGEIVAGTIIATANKQTNIDNNGEFIIGTLSLGYPLLADATSAIRDRVRGGVPACNVGINQKILRAFVHAHYQSGATTNASDGDLDDIIWNVMAMVRY